VSREKRTTCGRLPLSSPSSSFYLLAMTNAPVYLPVFWCIIPGISYKILSQYIYLAFDKIKGTKPTPARSKTDNMINKSVRSSMEDKIFFSRKRMVGGTWFFIRKTERNKQGARPNREERDFGERRVGYNLKPQMFCTNVLYLGDPPSRSVPPHPIRHYRQGRGRCP